MLIYKKHQILDIIYEYLETINELIKQLGITGRILNAVLKNRSVVEVKTENGILKKCTSTSKYANSSNKLFSLQQHQIYQ